MPFLQALLNRLKSLVPLDRLFAHIPEEKRRTALLFAGAGLAFVLLVFAGTSLLVHKEDAADSMAAEAAGRLIPIPPEELFLPEEPGFLPGVLFGREQRSAWTAGDAEPFWQDPLSGGAEPWRERVETALDELLERVP